MFSTFNLIKIMKRKFKQ